MGVFFLLNFAFFTAARNRQLHSNRQHLKSVYDSGVFTTRPIHHLFCLKCLIYTAKSMLVLAGRRVLIAFNPLAVDYNSIVLLIE